MKFINHLSVRTNPRIVRGGAFDDQPVVVRSATRYRLAPATRYSYYGFRPSRTYP